MRTNIAGNLHLAWTTSAYRKPLTERELGESSRIHCIVIYHYVVIDSATGLIQILEMAPASRVKRTFSDYAKLVPFIQCPSCLSLARSYGGMCKKMIHYAPHAISAGRSRIRVLERGLQHRDQPVSIGEVFPGCREGGGSGRVRGNDAGCSRIGYSSRGPIEMASVDRRRKRSFL